MTRTSSRKKKKKEKKSIKSNEIELVEEVDDIKLLSANLCCLPGGLRNMDLPTQSTISGGILIFSLITLIFCLLYFYTTITLPYVFMIMILLLPIPIFIGFICGGQCARINGILLMTLSLWGHDYKFERLEYFANSINIIIIVSYIFLIKY